MKDPPELLFPSAGKAGRKEERARERETESEREGTQKNKRGQESATATGKGRERDRRSERRRMGRKTVREGREKGRVGASNIGGEQPLKHKLPIPLGPKLRWSMRTLQGLPCIGLSLPRLPPAGTLAHRPAVMCPAPKGGGGPKPAQASARRRCGFLNDRPSHPASGAQGLQKVPQLSVGRAANAMMPYARLKHVKQGR